MLSVVLSPICLILPACWFRFFASDIIGDLLNGKSQHNFVQWLNPEAELSFFCLFFFKPVTKLNLDMQAKKLMEHKRKYERIREEKELKKRKERIRKAREEYEKQKEVRVDLCFVISCSALLERFSSIFKYLLFCFLRLGLFF